MRCSRMGDDIRATRPDALVVVAAEHFANFFMNNMPAFAIGMADHYEGPIEDEAFLRHQRARVPGNKALSRKLIEGVMQTVDVAYAEEWKFDHGIIGAAAFPDAATTTCRSSRPTSTARGRRSRR